MEILNSTRHVCALGQETACTLGINVVGDDAHSMSLMKGSSGQTPSLLLQWLSIGSSEFSGLNHKGLFRISGSAAKIRALRLKYDRGEEVDLVKEGDINSVASLLKLFLNQLPTAAFPQGLCTDTWAVFEENRNCTTEQTRCLKRLVSSLPEAHCRLVCFLIRFLVKVGANSDVNQMTLENLAIVFGPTLFRIPCGPSACDKQNLCNAMLLHVLQHHEDLFLDSSNNGFSPVEEQAQDLHPASLPQELSQQTEENEPG